MYAFATAIFAFAAPAKNRAMKAIKSEDERPKTVKNTVFPTKPIMITGRRPTRSESMPQKGENKNCAKE